MGYITINNMKIEFTDEKNVLSVIRKAGINLPTFCYHSELSTYGACRMCVVEDDKGKIWATCSERPKDGMVIYTNTPKVQHHRKMILELLLAAHCKDCTTCRKNMNCELQSLARQMGVNYIRFEDYRPKREIDFSSPSIVLDPNKCILCGDCVRTCGEIQGLGILNFAYRGSEMRVMPAFGKKLSETQCVGCGQCRVVCPTGAITIMQNIHPVWQLLSDPNVRVVAQIAPAVRVAVGDKFNLPKGTNAIGKLVAALRRMGFAQVYDTNFGADLTVIEETAEFIERFKAGKNLPLFTSCCPAWVKYCEQKHPDLMENVSSCRSPMEMFGALIKEEARMNKEDMRKTVNVAIMPCTAKKGEILREEHKENGEQIIDYVLTTTEICRMINEAGIDLAQMPEEALDMPFGLASGSAEIFGVTGGVTEAVLRQIVGSNRPEDLNAIALTGIRGDDAIKEATVPYGGREVKICVVSGLAAAEEVIQSVKKGEKSYDIIEVMACRRGCIAGGGQPLPIGPRTKAARANGVYNIDKQSQIKYSGENPLIKTIYEGILKGKEHHLLHDDLSIRNKKK